MSFMNYSNKRKGETKIYKLTVIIKQLKEEKLHVNKLFKRGKAAVKLQRDL